MLLQRAAGRATWPAAAPYADHDALFRQADTLLFGCPRIPSTPILQAYPTSAGDPRSDRSRTPSSARCGTSDPEVMARLGAGGQALCEHFGFGFVMFVGGYCAQDVLAAMTDRLHNDFETERKVVRNELARINRTRLERMLGPEGGYDNW